MSVPATIDQRARAYSLAHDCGLAQAAGLGTRTRQPSSPLGRKSWGCDRLRHHKSRFTLPFPLQDAQEYTMGSGRVITTAFRGTEPERIKDWRRA
ncbi:hypothetical protein [Streptomyces sp. AA0539]|uniref:hypothetical protein n=1 Tax=Streptomyces sp. AA0539 TaxID=1210045 RepID=UPI00037BEF75|nr:hypothetical protein [Streptomyces sp. AA0539]